MNHATSQISAMALIHRLKGDTGITLLDVRSPAEFRSGHIPGANNAPLENYMYADLAKLSNGSGLRADNPLYLTCQMGERAKRAAELFYQAGLDHVVLVEGGTQAWQEADLPIKTLDATLSLERQVQIAVGSLLILKVFFGFTVHELFFVAAAFIGAGLIVAGMTRWCGMQKLLARMPWNRRRSSPRSDPGGPISSGVRR